MSEVKINTAINGDGVSSGLAKIRREFAAFGEVVSKTMLGEKASGSFKKGLSGTGVAIAAVGLGYKVWQAGIEACTAALADFRSGLSGVDKDMAVVGQITEGVQKKLGSWAGFVLGGLAKGANFLFGTGTSEDILRAEKAAAEARQLELNTIKEMRDVDAKWRREQADAAEKKKKWQSEPEANARSSKIRMLEAELAGEEDIAAKKREALAIDLERADLQSRYGKDEETRYNAQVKTLELKKQIKDIDTAAAKQAAEDAKARSDNLKKEADLQLELRDAIASSGSGAIHTSGMLNVGISTAGERAFIAQGPDKQIAKLTEQLTELRAIKAKVTYGYVQK